MANVRVDMASPSTQAAIHAALSRDRNITDAMQRTANAVRDEARERAPVLTGTLRKSITTDRVYDPQTRQVVYRVGWAKATGWYGPLVELGTEDTPARPHLRPAAEMFRNSSFTSTTKRRGELTVGTDLGE